MSSFLKDLENIIFLILTTFASCFAYNSVSPLAHQLMNNYNRPESIVSDAILAHGIPSACMSIVFGYTADKYGFLSSFIPASLCVVIGNLIIALSGKSYALFIIGRVIFGLGGEPTLTIQSKAISIIFHGRNTKIAFGFIYFGYMLAEILSTFISYTSLSNAFWIQFGICCLSLLAIIKVSFQLRKAHTDAQVPKVHLRLFPGLYWLGFVSRLCAMTFMNTLPSLLTVFNFQLRGKYETYTFFVLQGSTMITYIIAGYLGTYVIIIGTLLFSAGMWVFYYTEWGTAISGVGTGCVGAMSSSLISRIVGPELTGSGMGLLFFSQFLIQSIWAYIVSVFKSVKYVVIIYAILPVFATIGFTILMITDSRRKSLQSGNEICEIYSDSAPKDDLPHIITVYSDSNSIDDI